MCASFAKQKVSLHRLNGKIDFAVCTPFVHFPHDFAIHNKSEHSNPMHFWSSNHQTIVEYIVTSLSFFSLKLHKFSTVTSMYTCLLTCLLQEIFNHFNRNPRMLCASIEFFEWMMRFKFKSIHLKSNVRYGFVGNKWHEHECASKWFMPFRNITFVRSVNVLQKIAFLMWKLFAQYAHNYGRTVEMITVFVAIFTWTDFSTLICMHWQIFIRKRNQIISCSRLVSFSPFIPFWRHSQWNQREFKYPIQIKTDTF